MANPALGTVYDPFASPVLNTTLWNSVTGGAVTLVPSLGMAQVACPTASGAFNTLSATGPYDATGGVLAARVTPVLRGNGGTRTILKLQVDANNSVSVRLESGVFRLAMQTAGVTTNTTLPAYDPAAHAWWRLREAGSTWYAEASADGYAWTTLASSAYSWSPAAVSVLLQAATSDVEPSGLFAGFQNVNTMQTPDGKMPSWPDVRFAVAFNQGANTTGQPAFVDLSGRMRKSWSADLAGRQYEMDQIQSGHMSVTLDNTDGALDALNTASPYAPNLLPGRRCRLQAVWPRSRNLLPQGFASGTSLADASVTTGSLALASGLAPAPTGHTTALAWTVPTSAVTSDTLGLGAWGSFPNPDPAAWPVTPGAQYAVGMSLSLAAGGDAALKLDYRISWYDITGTRILVSQGTGQSIGTLGTWTRITTTLTAPAGAVCARGGITPLTVPAAVTTVYATAWQVEQAAAPTPWTPGGVINPLWSGFVERWPQQWDLQGTYGLVTVTAVDALAGLASFVLQPNFAQSLLALGPSFMYPLTEPAGSTSFADATGRKGPRVSTASPVGNAGSVTAGNSVTGTGSVGSAGPVVTITNPTTGSSTSSAGRYLASSRPQSPPTSGGWTRVVCFRTTVTPTGGAYCAVWASVSVGSPSSQGFAILGVDSNGHGFGWVSNASGSATSSVSVPDVVVTDGNWHILVAQMAADGKTWTVAVDNHGYQGTTTGDYHPTGLVADGIGAVANTGLKVFQFAFSGDVAYATEFPYAIGNAAALDLGTGFSIGWAGETSAARAQRILTMAGYQGTLNTLDATTAMGGANLAGVDAMSSLQLVGDSEAGQVWVDGAGALWLASRQWRYLQNNPTVTFGENAAGGEIPYLRDVGFEFDDTHIYNDVSVTNQPLPGAPQAPPAHISDLNSQGQYFPKTLPRTINVQDGTAPQYAAQYLVSQYAQPLPRIATMAVDVAANPAVMAQALAVQFGTRAQVVRRPPAPAATITMQQFVEHLSWSGDDAGALKLSLQMNSATPYNGWGLASSLHTTVAVASTAGTATVTLAALTGAALNPANAVLPVGTQLTLGYGTANAETLTVKSMAATVAGYTQVAITFTANTTHNHAIGDLVCQPVPGGLTLPAAVQAAYPQSLDAAATLSATTPRVAY